MQDRNTNHSTQRPKLRVPAVETVKFPCTKSIVTALTSRPTSNLFYYFLHEVTCMVILGVSSCFVCKRTKLIFMECNVCESPPETYGRISFQCNVMHCTNFQEEQKFSSEINITVVF